MWQCYFSIQTAQELPRRRSLWDRWVWSGWRGGDGQIEGGQVERRQGLPEKTV